MCAQIPVTFVATDILLTDYIEFIGTGFPLYGRVEKCHFISKPSSISHRFQSVHRLHTNCLTAYPVTLEGEEQSIVRLVEEEWRGE
jgi:hypothetical protein